MLAIIIAALLSAPIFFIKKTGATEYSTEPKHITIYKHKKILILSQENTVIKTYPVCFGYTEGKKQKSGDNKTPEGRYNIIGKKHRSVFVHSLHISYPNNDDQRHAKIYGYHPGDSITIHGTGDDAELKKLMKRGKNWTRGCIGMHNHHIKDLFNRTHVGTIVDIHP